MPFPPLHPRPRSPPRGAPPTAAPEPPAPRPGAGPAPRAAQPYPLFCAELHPCLLPCHPCAGRINDSHLFCGTENPARPHPGRQRARSRRRALALVTHMRIARGQQKTTKLNKNALRFGLLWSEEGPLPPLEESFSSAPSTRPCTSPSFVFWGAGAWALSSSADACAPRTALTKRSSRDARSFFMATLASSAALARAIHPNANLFFTTAPAPGLLPGATSLAAAAAAAAASFP